MTRRSAFNRAYLFIVQFRLVLAALLARLARSALLLAGLALTTLLLLTGLVLAALLRIALLLLALRILLFIRHWDVLSSDEADPTPALP